ncbi:MAG: nucleotidyltransferase [bacterium]|nr:nucleotidyltransferase [bacterium]
MDIENLLKLLNEHKVRFVIIGATAFPVHGFSRATLDVDIFIEPAKENAARTLKALKAFGYDVSDLTSGELLSKKILIRQYLLETDVHPFVSGVSFSEIWKNKIEGQIGSTTVYFAGLEDLIKMKKSAARPKDLEDLKILEKLFKRNNKK